MLKIGPHTFPNNLILAPMAGVSDFIYRNICQEMGAGLAVGEMLSSNTRLWNSSKSNYRLMIDENTNCRMIQLLGNDAKEMAKAAKAVYRQGADIVDINMGCPAKKVCKKAAGSALLRQPKLVEEIVKAVVDAVPIPVTLKIRTGWSPEERNSLEIANIAEQSGVQALSIHGRTRACHFNGKAEYDSVKAIKSALKIPIIANGDINTEKKAKWVMDHTKVDGMMLARATYGNPWIFREIASYLRTGKHLPRPSADEVGKLLMKHVTLLHTFYGKDRGVRLARKYVSWYLHYLAVNKQTIFDFNKLESNYHQLNYLYKLINMLTKKRHWKHELNSIRWR